jgi:hypothetical protein
VRRLLQQALVKFRSGAELGIDEALFQPDIILLVSNAQQSLYFLVLIEQFGEGIFRDRPQYTAFHQLDILNGRLLGDEAVKGGDEIVLEPEPMGDLFAFEVVITTQAALLQEIQVPGYLPFRDEMLVPGQNEFSETTFCMLLVTSVPTPRIYSILPVSIRVLCR